MNNTFITWVLGAAVIGLGLFFLLGTPAGVSTATAPSTTALTTNGAAPSPVGDAATTAYWQSTPSGSATASAATTVAAAALPANPVAAVPATPSPACSTCATHAASSASTLVAPSPLPYAGPGATYVAAPHAGAAAPPAGGLMGGCGTPASPCAEMPCGSVMTCGLSTCPSCSQHAACGIVGCMHIAAGSHAGCEHNTRGQAPACAPQTTCDQRPRISRNGPSCVDECAFAQFYSTVPLPVCSAIRFAWSATRGEFLDPYSPTPVYFAPSTGFAGGEDVLINLNVTDAQGNEYSDQMKLHVNNTD